jgi:mannose-1-phosphate guanylyltransferase
MKALLLAAGLGTRLRPLTEHTPKCLVEIGGRPLLDYWLHDLRVAGVEKFLINTHHLAQQVQAFVSEHPLRDNIQLVHEPDLLGTARTIWTNRHFLGGSTTLVAHADNFCVCDWTDFFRAHRNRPMGTVLTMMVFRTDSPRDCGIVELDEQGVVVAFHEKIANPPGNLANGAVYLIEPELIQASHLFGSTTSDLSNEILPELVGQMFTWQNQDLHIDIGSERQLTRARKSAAIGVKVRGNTPE